jgi:hypothetical protein
MYEDILYACDEDVCPEYTKDPRKSSSTPCKASYKRCNSNHPPLQVSRRSLP